MTDNVQMIPMPTGMTRPETGPMQFGDDWPGLFIRGDNAFHFAAHLKMVLDVLAAHSIPDHIVISVAVVTGLVNDLQSSDVRVIRGNIPPTGH